jgi:hypothetical protein
LEGYAIGAAQKDTYSSMCSICWASVSYSDLLILCHRPPHFLQEGRQDLTDIRIDPVQDSLDVWIRLPTLGQGNGKGLSPLRLCA